jgi:hypothetical protein
VPTSKENGSGLDSKRTDRNSQSDGPTPDDQFIQWSNYIKNERRDIEWAQPLGEEFPSFIQQALALVSHETTRREVIKKLSSEGGLARLGEMLNTDFALLTDDAMRVFFEDRPLPFFRIIAHDDVRSSSVLEVHLGTILVYLYGVSGNRSSKVFDATVRGLKHRGYRKRAEFEPCLISLSAALDANVALSVNDELRYSAATMVALADNRALSSNMPEYCKKIKLRLGLGDPPVSAAENNKKHDVAHQKPTFELPVDRLGNLSKQGPRHDNDFEGIADIQILPTIGEILSDRTEYLPISDPSAWHLKGAAGLLDRQFRLFREDAIGRIRAGAITVPNGAAHTGARTYSYRNVRIAGAEMDSQRGLLFALHFDQPQESINKSKAERDRWWAVSGRLAPDALVTLIGSNKVAVFLTVVPAVSPIEEGSIEERFPRIGHETRATVVVQSVNLEAGIQTFLGRATETSLSRCWNCQ